MAGEKILLMEDNKDVRENVVDFLEFGEYTVISAVDGNDGLEKVMQGFTPDVIVSDIEMPGLNGPGAYRKIKEHYAAKNQSAPPVVFMTGLLIDHPDGFSVSGVQETLNDIYNAGPVGAIKKPFELDHLFAALEYALKTRGFPETPLKPQGPLQPYAAPGQSQPPQ